MRYKFTRVIVDDSSDQQFCYDWKEVEKLLPRGYELFTITSIKAGGDRQWPRHYIWLRKKVLSEQ